MSFIFLCQLFAEEMVTRIKVAAHASEEQQPSRQVDWLLFFGCVHIAIITTECLVKDKNIEPQGHSFLIQPSQDNQKNIL
jgi:hypothetical protein